MYVQHNQTVYYLTRQQNPTNVNAENPVIINGYNDDFKLVNGKAYVPHQLFAEILEECFTRGGSTIEAHIEVVSIVNTLCNHFIPPVSYIGIDGSEVFGSDDSDVFALLKHHSDFNEVNNDKLVAEILVNEPHFLCMAGNTSMVRWMCGVSDVFANEVEKCIRMCFDYDNLNCLLALKGASEWEQGLEQFLSKVPFNSLNDLQQAVLGF